MVLLLACCFSGDECFRINAVSFDNFRAGWFVDFYFLCHNYKCNTLRNTIQIKSKTIALTAMRNVKANKLLRAYIINAALYFSIRFM